MNAGKTDSQSESTTSTAVHPRFDASLVRRYDQPGPRYTSYPTAPHFVDTFTEESFKEHAELGNRAHEPRSLSLYAHIPFCVSPCFYCGCNRIITRDATKGERYLRHLSLEVDRVAPLFSKERDVLQLHLGGGTPNFLSAKQITHLVDILGEHFSFSASPDRDFSVELDPRHVDALDISALAAAGFNRASLGVQDFNRDVQRAINRDQSVTQTFAAIEACRESGFRSINVDLIYGLPRQTMNGFRETLETVLRARPDRLAVYGYAHLPEMFKAQRRIDPADLPDPDGRLDLLQLAVSTLSDAGYVYIGMDHFALPTDDLAQALGAGRLHRNFMGYMTHDDCDLVGLGVSAISHVGTSFSQNPRELAKWESALDSGSLPTWRGLSLSDDDVLRADVISQLMCHGKIDIIQTEQRYGITFSEYFSDAVMTLTQFQADGLVTVDDAVVEATDRGRYLLRRIAMCFDRYLHQVDTPRPPRYSATI